ncbi:RagB/SusD family nutrient uptake outer membrane protein [Barnesiella intestinihominis]|uniref:RagB/SusD family nutrient uptake outer membrane protein n=1 Tax=Barnesiella intestinihominis TaxID=487174 RepID=UPI0026751C83|nr:RagB/SusD family nutrient uptake outer membrane protein [Barnesiella intestinihominis]
MKKNIILYSFIALLSGTAGCSDMLDEYPLDAISPETYYNNADELRSATNQFYGMFPGAASGYTESADVVCIFNLPAEVQGIRTVPTSGGGWNWEYLRAVNFYLSHSVRCDDVDAREHFDGIARFFRAYFYFEKVKRFGEVPWFDRELSSTDPELFRPRDSRDFIMDKILDDLTYAINNISDKKDLYNVTHWTALALKSRICLFEGTFRKYHGIPGYEKFLNECATASKLFIDNAPYAIYQTGAQPYRDLFSSMNAIEEEVILARDYDRSQNVMHEANANTLSPTYGRPGMNKKIVNSYLMTNGDRFTDQPGYETMQYYDEMQNRDPRLTQTVVGPGYMRINSDAVSSPNFGASTTGYQITKWVTDASGDGYLGSSNDYILFRAAEVYLNYAEAKAELGTLTQDDLKISIKKIRDRVGMPNIDMDAANANPDPYLCALESGYQNVTGPNKGVILEIRRERTIELLLEGFRYYDIIRWKEGKVFEQPYKGMYFPGLTQGSGDNRYDVFDMNDGTVGDKEKVDICIYTGKKPSVKNIRKFYKLGDEFVLTDGDKGNIICHDIEKEPRQWREDRDYLYPIPTQERLLSNGTLSQNPNWNDGLDF